MVSLMPSIRVSVLTGRHVTQKEKEIAKYIYLRGVAAAGSKKIAAKVVKRHGAGEIEICFSKQELDDWNRPVTRKNTALFRFEAKKQTVKENTQLALL